MLGGLPGSGRHERRGVAMDALVMASLGALVGAGTVAALAALRGVRLFPGLAPAGLDLMARAEHISVWVCASVVAAIGVWAWTSWPMAGLWTLAAILAAPLMRRRGSGPSEEIDKVEAIATWTEQVRDAMSASAGLQQALVATAGHGPLPISDELRSFARRAPRGDLAEALHQLGADLEHPSADMVVAGLSSAVELDAGRLVPLLSRLAGSIRDEAQMRVRIEVGRARVRASMRIVGVSVAATVLLMLLAGRDLLAGYDSVAGQVWLVVVGSVVVLAGWSSRKLAEIPQPERFVSRRRLP